MATSTLKLKAESGNGKFYDTGDDKICVLQLKGGWYEMGQQYGTLAKKDMEAMWDLTVQPFLDKKWITEKEALQLWGKRVLDAMSTRKQQFFHGVANGIGWPVDRVVTLDQSFPLAMYEGKMHSFSGCTSMSAWGGATTDGNTVSNSLTRFKNLTARAGEAHGKIDAAKLCEIYDIRLFNEDGTFKENGGVTKPSKQDADLTNFQMVSDLSNLEVWLKVPPRQTDWRHVDLKPLFAD